MLVFHDLLGYGSHHVPKFVQQFADVGTPVHDGLVAYAQAVRSGAFPAESHTFNISDSVLERLYGGIVPAAS
ncbi:3-methyl-2-oxobutanoate hydroxymethyltransferase [compost metagenome]